MVLVFHIAANDITLFFFWLSNTPLCKCAITLGGRSKEKKDIAAISLTVFLPPLL